jgi:peptidoglycan/xylan/chitin deacetylase (PgdA/CDA1 family)
MYHRIGETRSASEAKYCITPQRFTAHMQSLARNGYRAIPIDALMAWLAGGPALMQGDFVLTFDDGYLGVRDHALPILERMGWPFTVFLVTDLLGMNDAWVRFDQVEGSRYPLLGADDVWAMSRRGCSFHSHSRTHASLPKLDDVSLADELGGSHAALTRLRGDDRPVYLAYPYGRVDERVETAARAVGYKAAFSVQAGFNRQDANPFRIRRLDVFGTDTPGALLRKMRLGSNDGSLRSSLGYYWHRTVGLVHGRAG